MTAQAEMQGSQSCSLNVLVVLCNHDAFWEFSNN